MRRHGSLMAATRMVTSVMVAVAALLPIVASATPAGAKGARSPGVIVLNGQGNDLDAYAATPPFKHQTLIQTRAKNPKGLDLNAQICFFPDGKRFIAGEDTGQPDPIQGWGIFRLSGTEVGKLRAREIGKLQPTYQGSADNAENYGCGILPDGRVVTTDIGNQATGPGDGQLIVWFPPFTKGYRTVSKGSVGTVPYCKIDVGIGTAGGIAVDDRGDVYLTSARGDTVGVWKYEGPFPTSNDASGDCGKQDATGAPLADNVHKSKFLDAGPNGLSTPNAIVSSKAPDSQDAHWYVSSVINGVINEYTKSGEFVQTVLQPPAGDELGAKPFSTGTPLGLGVGPDGTLYYADIGIVFDAKGIGPGNDTGTVRRIRFDGDQPRAPETMAKGLAFPDGIGVYVPRG